MNDDRKFTDTNLLIYSFDDIEPEKFRRANEWLASLWRDGTGRISFQVLHEFYSVVRRKFPARGVEGARVVVRDLLDWQPSGPNVDTIESAWRLQDRYQLSWWDALIVAAAQAQGCRYLLSEDLQHDQSFDTVTAINPFLVQPTDFR